MEKNVTELSRAERKKIEQKRKIIEISMELFKEKIFQKVTMEEIAKKVDIAKGTLYNYFPTKEEILVEFIKQSFMKKNYTRLLMFRSLEDTKSRMKHIFIELMTGVIEQADVFEIFMVYRVKSILSFNKSKDEESGLGYLAEEVLRLGRINSEIRENIPDGFIKDFFEFTFIEVAKEFYSNKKDFDLNDTVEKYVEIFVRSIKN